MSASVGQRQVELRLEVDGHGRTVSVAAAESLLFVLRERLEVTAPKASCEAGHCGACTVLLDGSPVRSCLLPVARAAGSTVRTAQSLGEEPVLRELQEALVAQGGLQCGFCTPGMVARLAPLLQASGTPSDEEIREALSSNLCRCTGYENIVAAVRSATGRALAPREESNAGGAAVGARLAQKTGAAKVTGRQRYTGDMSVPGMLHAKILRSPHAHAQVRSIDVSPALEVEGVVDAISFEDVPAGRYNSAFRNPNDAENLRTDERVLNERARFEGDRVAAVAAETEQAAVEGVDAIEVDWEPLPFHIDAREALSEGATEIHEGTGNLAAAPKELDLGDVDAGFEHADVRVEGEFSSGPVQHCNLEPKAVIAEWNGEQLTITATTQVPFHMRTVIRHALDIPESRVHVIAPDMGGGNGERSDPADEYAIVLLATRTGRPVRLVNSREEQFTSSRVRHPAVVRARLGAKADGTLTARDTEAVIGTGGYATMGYRVMLSLGIRSAALYKTPNIRYRGRLAYTNTPVGGGMRGFGSPQACFVIETQLDQIAGELGMDPIEIRIKNLVREGDPYLDLPDDWRVRSAGAIDGLRVASERTGWTRKREALPAAREDGLLHGIGVAVGSHISTVMPYYRDHGDAAIQLQEDGSALLFTGPPDTGTGSTTVFAQLAAEELEIPAEDVEVRTGDTDTAPYDQGAHSSRTTYVAGAAVKAAAENLKAELAEEGARMLEANPGDVEVVAGSVRVKGTPSRSRSFAEVAHWVRYESDRPRRITAQGFNLPRSVAPPAAVCVAEVAVDPRDGRVAVERMFEAIDCGVPVNPLFVEGQLHGAIHMGVGAALGEEMRFDDRGRLLTRSFAQYQVMRADDMPKIETAILDSSEPTGPFGAKGLGEASAVPVAPAVANAVAHAVGVHPKSLPIRPEDVLELIGEGS